ncbi:3-hydroxybutyryl-CoA dehydrogenase [Alteribacillus iranensis]|uniref:3-hydroxybutyryl-CoA dehydrogenase n=1 Tax=Alteribacillus iranensis TaxID=930128 RepID=A0A1I2C1I0_9BACI|nr:3-hydroxybutyryl-CoA dehydrogenase [Alteribacillus iranensis]SFE62042.1 3-hydroxybutyryl-CoA dehydrogenase [Alteribacillus iranensis]
MNIQTVAVIGAGQMGTGITQTFAQFHYNVLLYDSKKEQLSKGVEGIRKQTEKLVQKGKMTQLEQESLIQRIVPVSTIKECRNANLVVEAAVENMDIKKEIFQELDQCVSSQTILATNTSSLSITELAAETTRPDHVIGMHFMNPVPVMKLVEVIRGLATSEETYQIVKETAESLRKTAVEVKDYPGFVSNRVLMPLINEAIFSVYEGVAAPEDVDHIMTLGMNHPMGPLKLADFIGLDTCLSIMETLHEGFGEDKYRPCPLLRKYVNAGWLGKKSGRGFYRYSS